MARPRKQEVDYFPHYCDHGKVLFILENNFKNDGYAVFYKIEELLARTEGHCYDCSKPENWEYLLSKMNIDETIVSEIIEKLVVMNVIEPELWKEKRIWMQSFVDSITDAYARRKVHLPLKPELMSTETPVRGINVNINPQSKEEESKVNKSKERKTFIAPSLDEISLYCLERKNNIKPQHFLDYQTARDWKLKGGQKIKDWQAVIRTWEHNSFNKEADQRPAYPKKTLAEVIS